MTAHQTVFTLRAGALAAIAALLPIGLSSPAARADDKNAWCNQYGVRAADQNDRAFYGNCGFRGPRWHSDVGIHQRWCNSLNDPMNPYFYAASAEESAREAGLRQCGAAAMVPPRFSDEKWVPSPSGGVIVK